jgi:hypothetical protein
VVRSISDIRTACGLVIRKDLRLDEIGSMLGWKEAREVGYPFSFVSTEEGTGAMFFSVP